MSRNHRIVALILGAITIAALISGWAHMLILALIGTVLLPLWALLLSSVFLIFCLALGSIIVAISNTVLERRVPAPAATTVATADEDRPKAA